MPAQKMKIFTVYWYHLSTHTDPFMEGYVGVTNQLDIRKRCHIAGRSGGSKILSAAFKKYGEENILYDVLYFTTDKSKAYEMEKQYRPVKEVGWNIAIGGGLPPDTTGRVDPPEVRKKRSESLRKAKEGKVYPSVFKGMTNRHNEERRVAIGAFHRGKKLSEEHKKAFLANSYGEANFNAKETYLVHIDEPEVVHYFKAIKVASDTLGIPYQALRSLVQRTLKKNVSSEPSRTGWIVLTASDAQNPIEAVARQLEVRKERIRLGIAKREAIRASKGIGVTPSNNI